ncbi:MAG: lysine N(6)-hydroxylase/L-ornithine N(5)-oxygenase family protein [Actinocrinis sp.]
MTIAAQADDVEVADSQDGAVYDLVGVGIGPFNLALAALAEPVAGLRTLFLDENPSFRWHPGMMVDGATLQVPFLADLVSLVDPANRRSYLAHLRDTGRLFEFYLAERSHIPRIEYESYCRTVAHAVESCRFGARVTEVRHSALPGDGQGTVDGFAVSYIDVDDSRHTILAANVVLGIGTEPIAPAALTRLCRAEAGAAANSLVTHSAFYLRQADWIHAASDVTVLGSGQSGAEVVLDLLRSWHRPGRRLRWLTRSAAFEPMEYSKIGLEHFTPDYVDHFHALPDAERAALLSSQGRLYKAVSADTLSAIRDELDTRSRVYGVGETGVTMMPGVEAIGGQRNGERIAIDFRHRSTGERMSVCTERLVLATGYAPRNPECLAPINADIERDAHGRYVIDRNHRVRLNGTRAGLYVQNAELHTHGVGTPDLGLGAYRAATILNAVTGRTVYPLPSRTAHTAFAPAVAAAADPGLTLTTENPGHEQPRHHPDRDRARIGADPAGPDPVEPGPADPGAVIPGPSGSPGPDAVRAH